MRYSSIDTVIVSGGMIQEDFALDFLKKIQEERKGKKLVLMAADRGLDFFRKNGITPDIADGDFDSLSVEGKKYLENLKDTEIIRLQPEKDDTDTQSTLNLAIAKGSENILILGATGGENRSSDWKPWTSYFGKIKRSFRCYCRCPELYLPCEKRNYPFQGRTVWKVCLFFFSRRGSGGAYS